ncbi:hypothetical protein DCO46_04690 [Flavobacterium sp. HTF]|nr:hypothetical protein DCO46_04690 [Flavobacterium sp. HTF]
MLKKFCFRIVFLFHADLADRADFFILILVSLVESLSIFLNFEKDETKKIRLFWGINGFCIFWAFSPRRTDYSLYLFLTK